MEKKTHTLYQLNRQLEFLEFLIGVDPHMILSSESGLPQQNVLGLRPFRSIASILFSIFNVHE